MADMHFRIGGRRRTKFFAMEHAPDSGPVHDIPRSRPSAADAMLQELHGTIGPGAVSRLVASGEFDRIMGHAPPQSESVAKPETIQRKQEDRQSTRGITDPTEFCRAFFAELEPKTSAMIFDSLRALQEQKAETKDPDRVMAINRLVRKLQILRQRLNSMAIACRDWEKQTYLHQEATKLFNLKGIMDNFNNDAQAILRDYQAIKAAMVKLGM